MRSLAVYLTVKAYNGYRIYGKCLLIIYKWFSMKFEYTLNKDTKRRERLKFIWQDGLNEQVTSLSLCVLRSK